VNAATVRLLEALPMIRTTWVLAWALAACTLLAGQALAQFSQRANGSGASTPTVKGGTPIAVPGVVPTPQGQPTPEQMRDIMTMRALQNRGGRGQVRTGVPQIIGLGPQPMLGPVGGGNYDDANTSTRKSSSQRRAEARAAREEQKRGGAANPQDKKALAAKAKADKKAAAEKRAKQAAEKKAKAAGKKPPSEK
jgi:hypothetical protein